MIQKKNEQYIRYATLVAAFAIGVLSAWNIAVVIAFVGMVAACIYTVRIPPAAVMVMMYGAMGVVMVLDVIPEYHLQEELISLGILVSIVAVVAWRIITGTYDRFVSWREVWSWCRRYAFECVAVGIAVVMGLVFSWDITQIIVYCVFILTLLLRVPVRKVAVGAAAMFCASAFLLLISRDAQAEDYAVYTYYTLLALVLRIMDEGTGSFSKK